MNLIQKQNAFIPFLFDDFINREFNLDKSIFETLPAVNIKELDSLFQIELAVPGKNKNDFQIEIEDGLLTISSNVEELGEKLTKRFNEFCDNYGKKLILAFEPGKFLVSQAGYFLTRVNSIKQTTSTVFAQVNSGFNHLIRPMFYGSHHDIINISNPKGKERFYTVVGYICETDTFGSNRKIAEINEGDILMFKNAGAYCFTMSNNYNSRFRPAEVLWHNNRAHTIRKQETLDDLISNQILIDFSEKVEIN